MMLESPFSPFLFLFTLPSSLLLYCALTYACDFFHPVFFVFTLPLYTRCIQAQMSRMLNVNDISMIYVHTLLFFLHLTDGKKCVLMVVFLFPVSHSFQSSFMSNPYGMLFYFFFFSSKVSKRVFALCFFLCFSFCILCLVWSPLPVFFVERKEYIPPFWWFG
jgi:hypothetical protein